MMQIKARVLEHAFVPSTYIYDDYDFSKTITFFVTLQGFGDGGAHYKKLVNCDRSAFIACVLMAPKPSWIFIMHKRWRGLCSP